MTVYTAPRFGSSAKVLTQVSDVVIAETTLQESVTYDGVTFAFDRPVPVGHFVTGKPFVVSSEGFQIVSVAPASVVLNGGWAHGLMQDPLTSGNSGQGFDEFVANFSQAASAQTPYANNIDPGHTGEPVALVQGAETSFVKAVRRADVTAPNEWQTMDRYVPLTVLDSVPPADAYMPSPSGLTKILKTRRDIDMAVLRSLPLASGLEHSIAGIQAAMPDDTGFYGSTGARLRLFRLDEVLGEATTNYSGDTAPLYAQFCATLHRSDLPVDDRQAIIDKVAEFALQIDGLHQRGAMVTIASRTGGAGQQGGIAPLHYYGAFLFQDDGMLARAKEKRTNMDGNGIWVTPDDVGMAVNSNVAKNEQTFFDGHVGEPWSLPEDNDTDHQARYLWIQETISVWEIAAISLLQNGPGGESGMDAILNGGPFDATNPQAACVAMMDRVRHWLPQTTISRAPSAQWRNLYDIVQPLTGLTPWAGKPDQVPYGDGAFSGLYDDDIFSAGVGAGEIDFDLNGRDYATEPVTDRHVRYSLDGIQWVVVTGLGSSGKLSGLLCGAVHWCGIRQVSASGAGLWSANFPYDGGLNSGNDRGKVTTVGSAANAAPVNTVVPEIHVRRYPGWPYKVWDVASALIDPNDVELAVGVGYWSGYPAPNYTFQWKRDGVPVAGADQQIYTRTAVDAGAVLTCDVTATNASGSVTVMTSAVQCPGLTVLAAGTLIDTDFRGRFAVDYEAELGAADASASGGTFKHEPTAVVEGVDASFGWIRVDKNGTNPRFDLPFQQAAVAGTSYAVTAQAVAHVDQTFHQFAGTLLVEIRNAAGEVFFSITLNPDQSKGESYLLDIDDSFTVPAGTADTSLMVRVRNDFGSGGPDGGQPVLTSIRVAAL